MSIQPTFRRSVFLVLLLVTLSFGWWPFSFLVENDVTYLPNESAWSFNSRREAGDRSARGIAVSAEKLDTRNWPGVTILVELRGRPNNSGLGIFLEFFDDREGEPLPALLVSEWQDHLAMRSRRDRRKVERGYSEIGHRDLFGSGKFVQIVISSEGNRTHLYAEGKIIETRSDFSLVGIDNKFFGDVVIGNSANGTRPFTGEIRRIAIYDAFYKANSAEIAAATPVLDFDGRNGSYPDGFVIAERFSAPKRLFFNPIAAANLDKPSYRSDVVVNSLGFIPVGLCFVAMARRRASSLVGVLFLLALASFSLSFTIEWGQGFLVHRDSSALDVALNTMSGCMAVFVPRRWILFL